MSESLYAKLGKLHEQVEQKDAAISAYVQLLANIVTGEIELSRVMVNTTDRSVHVAERGQRMPMPMQFNGLPNCVVQPTPTEEDKLRERIRELEAELLIASTGAGQSPMESPLPAGDAPTGEPPF